MVFVITLYTKLVDKQSWFLFHVIIVRNDFVRFWIVKVLVYKIKLKKSCIYAKFPMVYTVYTILAYSKEEFFLVGIYVTN